MFVVDQCSWWINVCGFHGFHEFPSPKMFNKVMNCLAFSCNKPVNHKITGKSTQTSKVLTIHEHWPPRIRMNQQWFNALLYTCRLVYTVHVPFWGKWRTERIFINDRIYELWLPALSPPYSPLSGNQFKISALSYVFSLPFLVVKK